MADRHAATVSGASSVWWPEPDDVRWRHRSMLRHLLLLAALAVAVDGCGATQAGSVRSNSPAAATTSPGPAASASPETSQTTTGLKLGLIDTFGPLWYCDPDIYPIAHTETDRALAR